MGFSFQNVTFERSFSTSVTNPWETIAASDGDTTGACDPPVQTVGFGQTLRTTTPSHMALETDYFCIQDITSSWQFEKNLKAVTANLAERSSWEWARKFTADYYALAGHNLTLRRENGGSIVDNGTSGYSTASPPTAALSFGVLEEIYMSQSREGGSVLGTAEDTQAPVGVLITSQETYINMLRNNAFLANNINYAWMGARDDNPLLPSGVQKRRKLFGNWVIDVDPYPRRFILSGGGYIEVPVWLSSSTTKGNKQTVNPAWLAAPYEESIVYSNDVYRSLSLDTPANPAPGWTFDPLDSMGQWKVKNIIDRLCNVDGTKIFWRAVFKDAAEPLNPDVGYTILHARCGHDLDLVSCYGS